MAFRLAFYFFVLLSACTKKDPETLPPKPTPPPLASESKPTLALLTTGALDFLPESLVFAWSEPTEESATISFEPKLAYKVGEKEGTRFTLTPEQPFKYETTYSVSVNGTKAQLVTPPFIVRRAELTALSGHRATVTIGFSGPPQLSSVGGHVKLTQAGKPVASGKAEQKSREEITLTFDLPRNDALLEVRTEPGITSSVGNAQAPSFATTINPHSKGDIAITSALVKETADGFYVDISCNDMQTRNKYGYWDYNVEQCPVDTDSVSRVVSISPRVKLSVSATRTGFRLFGDLRFGTYKLAVGAGLRTTTESMLMKPFTAELNVPHRRAAVSFASQGRYMPRSALQQVPINHMNMPEAMLRVRHVPSQNVLFWLSSSTDQTDERVADEVASERLTLTSKTDQKGTTWVDLAHLVGDKKDGVYEFLLEPAENKPDEYDSNEDWEQHRARIAAKRDAARLVLTDLVVVAKRHGADAMSVWVRDAHQLEGVAGAKVEIFTQSNRLLKTATTDKDGRVRIEGVIDPVTREADRQQAIARSGRIHSDTTVSKEPFAILVRKNDDLTFLEMSELAIDLAEADVAGDLYTSDKAYTAAIYSDRGVYRPGETAHIVATVRTGENVAPPPGMPVIADLLDPRKRTLQTLNGKTNDAGMVSFDVSFQAQCDTGRYELELRAGEKRIGAYGFNVEEFVPERMKVVTTAVKQDVAYKSAAEVLVDARYLYGAKASGEPVELSCALEATTFKPKANNDYFYGVWREKPQSYTSIEPSQKGALDKDGKASLRCAIPTVAWRGAARLTASASVLEAGSGRATVDYVTMTAHQAPFYVGLKAPPKLVAGSPTKVSGIIVDWNGEVQKEKRQIDIELFSIDPEYNWEWLGTRYNWRVSYRLVRESGVSIDAKDGRFEYTFPAQYAAGYLVRAKSGGAEVDLKMDADGYSYWPSANGSETTPRPMRPSLLDIGVPKEMKVGEAGELTVRAPYAGKLLITLESNDVVDARWVSVKAGESKHPIKIDRFIPNVYVSALLLKDPHAESAKAYLPARAFGVRSVPLVPEAYKLPLALATPKEVKPHDELVVTLDAGPIEGKAYATVAAVDEGILQLTRFKTPNILAELFQKRALSVISYETYGWSLLLPSAEKSSGGGEGSGTDGKPQAVKPVALWSGIVDVGKTGKATVKFKVPQYRGELRVMAVVVSAGKAGSAEAAVTVRDPLVLQATFPRFLLKDDRFIVPVNVTNMTGKAADVKVTLAAENGVELEREKEKKTHIEAGTSGTVTFVGRAIGSSGAAKIRVLAEAPGVTSMDEGDIPLQPNAPLVRETTAVALKQGKNDLTAPLQGFTPDHERTSIWVTPNRYGPEMSHLRYLVNYPYGCIEQTTSGLRPLLYLSSLVGDIAPELVTKDRIEDKIVAGIRRILSMQTPSGGFAYWPGSLEPVGWGSAYATHALLDAKFAGYPVPDDRIEQALQYLETAVVKDEYGAPYMHFVLAKANKGNKAKIRATLETLAKKQNAMGHENEFLLQAALYIAGDRRFEAQLKKPPPEEPNKRTNDWYFWSSLRTRGLELLIREELFPGDPSAEPLAQAVADSLRKDVSQSWFYTTQELAWSISALGKRAAGGAKDYTVGALTRDGKTIPPLPKKNKEERQMSYLAPGLSGGKPVTLTIDEMKSGGLFAIITVEGIKAGVPHPLGEKGVRIKREYRLAESSKAKLGEMFEIVLTIENLRNEEVRNVAVVDRLPAGLELENVRLNRSGGSGEQWQTTFMNLRDDRIELFGHLQAKQKVQYSFPVRAVTAGKFDTPPARVEAMYDPELWAAVPGTLFTVVDPWNAM